MLRLPCRAIAEASVRRCTRPAFSTGASRLLAVAGAGVCALVLNGCGGSVGTKPSAQIRGVEAATNTVDVNSTADDAYVLINGAALTGSVKYSKATEYLYVEAGTSGISGGFPNGMPTILVNGVKKTVALPTYYNSTTNVTTTVPPSVTNYSLQDGHKYTAYLCGRPDVQNSTVSDYSDIDPRYFKGVVLEDNQPAAPPGTATVRVLVAAADSGNVNVRVDNSDIAAFDNVGYAPLAANPSSGNATVGSGTVSVTVVSATDGSTIVPATMLTLASGGKYTLVVDEPTAVPSPAVKGTAPTSATYALSLIHN